MGRPFLFNKMLRPLLRPAYNIIFVKLFALWERLGFHITLNSYNSPIPDAGRLKDELWTQRSKLIGVDMNEQQQIQFLEKCFRFKQEYDSFPRTPVKEPHQFHFKNYFFESVDAEILYCMIRHFKPKRIIEIGSGFSTLLSAQALQKNATEDGPGAELIAIEPYPNQTLVSGFPGLTKLIPVNLEELDIAVFNDLQENDILFIDSSHILKTGNDVQIEYLEILPRLNRGVIVHVHDIFLPMEYPREYVLKMHWFWSEQYLLQAFLAFNSAYEVLWAASYMHWKHPDKLEKAFGSYDKRTARPGSFWMRKKG